MRLTRVAAVVLLSALAVWAEGTTVRGDQLYSAGTAALLKGDFAEAEKSFRQLRTEFVEDIRWGPGLAAAIRQDARQQDLMESYLDVVPENRELRAQYWAAGQALVFRGRDREALAEFESALRAGDAPDKRSADWVMLGVVYGRLKERDEMMAAYFAALKEDPANWTAKNNLAYEWAEAGENLDQALEYAKYGVQRTPADPNVVDTLGWVYFKKGMLADAEATLIRGMLLERSSDGSRPHLAAVMDARGEWGADRRAVRAFMTGALTADQTVRMKELLRKIQSGK